METFADIIRTHAAARPDAPALTFGDETLSFADLHERSSRAANALREAGVGAGDRVAVLTKNRSEHFELIFACSKIGAILVGLNWRLSPREIAEIAADAAPKLIVAASDEATLLDDTPEAARPNVLLFGADYDAWRDAAPAEDPGHEGAPDETILILYTSGTTGLPKGVMLSNAAMSYTRRLAEAWSMSAGSVNLVAMPLFHIGGCGYGSSTMMAGGHTVLMAEVDPAKIVELIAAHRVTHTFLVPAVVQALLNTPGVETADLSSLKLLMYGAAPIGDVLLRRAIGVLGCGFMHAYGMTESAGTVVILSLEEHDPDGPKAGLLKSCGAALPWVELRVIDPAADAVAKTGEVGEIQLRTPMLMSGYWNNEAETRRAITGDGWFRTGDAAYQDEAGRIFLFDRFKDMIISGGENIYPAEIENVLNGHPAIHEVAVIGAPHERWGETPLAVIVPKEGAAPEAEEIIAFTRERLAHYKCPTRVAFAETLPRNASGKLLKHELRRLHGPPAVPALQLLRRWVVDYFNRHDPAACADFVAEDYALEIGDVTLKGRDDVWLPAVDKQMRLFPGLQMTVHRTLSGEGWAALAFSQHGASEGRIAVWSGVAIYRSDGRILTGCAAAEDYMTRRRQLKSGVPDPVEPPCPAPWDAPEDAPDAGVEAAVTAWLSTGWPAPAVRCDDEHITGDTVRFETRDVKIGALHVSGPEAAFQVRQSGTYLGGLAGAAAGSKETFIDCCGIVRVEDGRVVEGRVIRDRTGLLARVGKAS